MFTWTKQKIDWYQQAANYTKYYQEIFNDIQPFIHSTDHVCDLGCGLGDLSLKLASIAHKVTAIDISEDALHVLKEKMIEKQLSNIEVIQSDWANIKLVPQWDVVVVSFFKQNYADFIKLLKMCRKKVIVVSTNGSDKDFLPRQDEHRNRGKIKELRGLFDHHQLNYQCMERTLQFGQPLASVDDARAYIQQYVPDCEQTVMEAHLKEHLKEIETGDFAGQLFLSNKKEIGIFVIEKQEALNKLPELQ